MVKKVLQKKKRNIPRKRCIDEVIFSKKKWPNSMLNFYLDLIRNVALQNVTELIRF